MIFIERKEFAPTMAIAHIRLDWLERSSVDPVSSPGRMRKCNACMKVLHAVLPIAGDGVADDDA